MEIEVTSEALEAMRAAALAAYPREACGIMLGTAARITEFRETANVHASPETHFEIDPQALIDAHRAQREGGFQVLGYFHSHPVGSPTPSATDIAMASKDGSIWAICGGQGAGGDIRFYHAGEGGFAELSLRTIEG